MSAPPTNHTAITMATDHKRPHPANEPLDIQPLRDLARNFDIDIEPYLQEYLYFESLDDAPFDTNTSWDGREEKAASFAAAALKIQNSTSIYTRKVDFLHQVVYEAHEALNEFIAGSSDFKTKNKKSGGEDGDIEDFRAFDSHQEFLLLDDVLPVDREGRRINLPTARERSLHATNFNATLDATRLNETTNNNVTLLSLGGIMSTTRDSSHFISRESIAHTSPAAMSRMLLQNLNTCSWRVGCDVDARGALVMPGAVKGVFVNGELKSGEKGGVEEGENVQIFPGGLSPQADGGDVEFDAMQQKQDVDFGEDDGMGFELNDEDEVQPEPEMETVEPREEPKKKRIDPLALLDPHEPSRDKPNPLKIGVTYIIPEGMDEDDRPSACVTGSRTRNSKQLKRTKKEVKVDRWQILPFASDWLDALHENDKAADSSTGNTSHRVLNSLFLIKELIYGKEFAYLADAYAKQRHLAKQARLKEERAKRVEANDQAAEEAAGYYNDDDDYGGGFDYGGDDDSFGNNDAALDHQENNNRVNRSNVDFAAIDDVFASASMQYKDGDNDVDYNSQLTFEELCRAHLRKFAKTAEIYASETQLTKRVGMWQNGLVPILEEQERRPEFDIHSIGRDILQRVEDKLSIRKRTAMGDKKLVTSNQANGKANTIGFQSISKDCEEYEVCRLFLSTLLLCNSGNINVHDGNDVGSAKSLEIELLNSKFEVPTEGFLAPSAQEESLRE